MWQDTPVDAVTGGAPVDAAAPADAVTSTIAGQVEQVGNSFERFVNDPSVDNAVGIFGPMLLSLGQALFGLVVLLVVVSFVGRWTSGLVGAALRRAGVESTVSKFLARVARYAIWIVAVPIAFELFGVKTTSLAAVIGAAGLAIGLGMQGALSNIAAGIMLLLLRPMKIGDLVELQGESGEVRDLGIFYTTINTFSNRLLKIPNGEVLGHTVENLTGNDTRRIELAVGVAYGTDLRRAETVLRDAVTEHVADRVAEPAPKAWLVGFGASSIDFEVHVHGPSRDFFTVRHQAIHAINEALDAAGIEIPFPQRTLHLPAGIDLRTTNAAADDDPRRSEE